MENGKQSMPQMAKALTWGKCQALKAIFQINKHPVSVSHKALEGKCLYDANIRLKPSKNIKHPPYADTQE